MDRGWAITSSPEGNVIALGFDDGTLAIKLGGDEPVSSLRKGKLIFAKNMEIHLVNLKALKVNSPGWAGLAPASITVCKIFFVTRLPPWHWISMAMTMWTAVLMMYSTTLAMR